MVTQTHQLEDDVYCAPVDHIIVGTCGKCGGPVVSPMVYTARSSSDGPPEWCDSCGAKPKPEEPEVKPKFGPVREMHDE